MLNNTQTHTDTLAVSQFRVRIVRSLLPSILKDTLIEAAFEGRTHIHEKRNGLSLPYYLVASPPFS